MSRHATRHEDDTFKVRLKKARLEAGIGTQEQAARQLAVTLRTYQRWELGEGEPRGEQFARVCLAFGKPAEWFYPPRLNGEAA